MLTVSPSATNAAISASPANDEWKLSISPFCGMAASPRMIPATKTARKPEPPATAASP